jgi:ABC-2 type transport system permease protein
VLAAQSIVIVILSVVPNLSIAYSAVSVVGVVSFSLGGFSFPVPNMYVPFQFLTNLLPVRHYFLIYANSALNGYPLYYCRSEFVALLLMIGVALISIPRLHRVILNYAKR